MGTWFDEYFSLGLAQATEGMTIKYTNWGLDIESIKIDPSTAITTHKQNIWKGKQRNFEKKED